MSITVSSEPFIVTATINRPAAMNAVNFDVMERLESLLDELEQDKELRLFVFTGTGKSFISGGDLKEFHQIKDAAGAKEMTRRMIQILNRIENLPFWTLASINGDAYGGGWEMALAFDFRVASSSANIGFTQGKFYLPPGWGGIKKLQNSVGRSLALFWLGSQKVINAKEAREAGFIQEYFDEHLYYEKLEKLKEHLILNDRDFITYLKNHKFQHTLDEIEPFSRFWESNEHFKRVNEFLRK